VKTSTEYLDMADQESKKILEERRKSDETAAPQPYWSLYSALCWHLVWNRNRLSEFQDHHRTLTNLMMVARQIGNTGDLDHTIDIERQDEIGELARTFGNMVIYLKEMAAVSEAIAGGDLTVQVQPRSKHDTLAMRSSAWWRDCEAWYATCETRPRKWPALPTRLQAPPTSPPRSACRPLRH